MRYTALLLFLFIHTLAFAAPYDWGKTGHRVTGEIAHHYLSNRAERAIEQLLNGESLAKASTFADEIKSDSQYRSYGPWHYVNIPFDKTYDTHPKNPKGDIIQGIDKCITVLKDKSASRTDKVFHLKLLIHLIGDLHQPMHAGLAKDKGGNDFQVRWFNEGTNLHSVWDTKMIEDYGMSYTELAKNLDKPSNAQLKAIQAGTPREWLKESRILVKEVYKSTEIGEKLGYRYMYDHFKTVQEQLVKGGIRLAEILNSIYG